MKHPALAFPPKPTKATRLIERGNFDEDEYEMAKFTWNEEYKATLYKKENYKENESNAWALMHDQCLPELKNKLEGTGRYQGRKADNDAVLLLVMISSYCCQYDTLNNEYKSIVGAIKNLLFEAIGHATHFGRI
jgi:hypothetical protein